MPEYILDVFAPFHKKRRPGLEKIIKDKFTNEHIKKSETEEVLAYSIYSVNQNILKT